MALSNNGRRIAASYQNKIQQWDATTGQKIGPEMNGHNQQVEDIAYSPDDRYLVSVSRDHTLRFWNANTESQIGEPINTTAVGDISSVDFSHDGRRVFVTATAASLDNNPPFVGGGSGRFRAHQHGRTRCATSSPRIRATRNGKSGFRVTSQTSSFARANPSRPRT